MKRFKAQCNPSNMIGRYAPSPTGSLHFGNLRTAVIAWLHARLQQGRFILRMEDIDTPRVVAGSDQQILRDLEWLGLDWDGSVEYQSARQDLYRDALSVLKGKKLIYPCFCSRKDIQQASSAPHGRPGVYPGTCAQLDPVQINELYGIKQPALRCRVPAELADNCGDFVVQRADQLIAYQLAVVVDDLDQGITDVVRGNDLADSTARQQYLARCLSRQDKGVLIRYHHAPLMNDGEGRKMSKRDGAASIREWRGNGRNQAELLAYLACSLGLLRDVSTISAPELLDSLSIDDVHRVFCA